MMRINTVYKSIFLFSFHYQGNCRYDCLLQTYFVCLPFSQVLHSCADVLIAIRQRFVGGIFILNYIEIIRAQFIAAMISRETNTKYVFCEFSSMKCADLAHTQKNVTKKVHVNVSREKKTYHVYKFVLITT